MNEVNDFSSGWITELSEEEIEIEKESNNDEKSHLQSALNFLNDPRLTLTGQAYLLSHYFRDHNEPYNLIVSGLGALCFFSYITYSRAAARRVINENI